MLGMGVSKKQLDNQCFDLGLLEVDIFKVFYHRKQYRVQFIT